MISRLFCLFTVCLFLLTSVGHLQAQHSTVEIKSVLAVKKDITFIVRKPDRIKNIAARFHVPIKLFLRLNPALHKRQMVYAGKKLMMPVWLRKKDPNATGSDYNLADYELATDSLDIYVREDFVCMADIETDTIRRIAINKELKRIDKKGFAISLFLDSVEEDSRQNLSKHEIAKLPMTRARRLGKFAIGHELDSLLKAKQKLMEERAKIDIRVADYEYLLENADYAASHPDKDKARSIEIREWADDPGKHTSETRKTK
jgi:hypothetical protein